MPSFSAALLAGGQSLRMGRDKALLPMPGWDFLLWRQQLHTLEKLRPEKIFWSGPIRDGLPAHLVIVPDKVKKAGPLAGISACLDILESDLLVVLAIDLPQMTATFLQSLLAKCSPECGAVIQRNNFSEPLATVYPKRMASLAKQRLEAGRYAMQELIRKAIKQEMLQAVSLEEKDLPLFRNLNTPADLHHL